MKISEKNYLIILIVLLVLLGVGSNLMFEGNRGKNGLDYENHFFSFEEGLENWETRGTDLDNPLVDWSIDVSENLASHGETSAMYYLSNVNDAGKIWIERSFDVDPNTNYRVDISYNFVSADYGDFNLWTIITGVHKTSPETRDDLVFQGDTGNEADSNVGFKWMNKSYDFTIESSSEGEIYVTLGVWGTWETDRIYFIDNVEIEFEEIN